MSTLMVRELEYIEQFKDLSLVCEMTSYKVKLGMVKLTSGILEEIRECEKSNLKLTDFLVLINKGSIGDFRIEKKMVL